MLEFPFLNYHCEAILTSECQEVIQFSCFPGVYIQSQVKGPKLPINSFCVIPQKDLTIGTLKLTIYNCKQDRIS